MSFGRIVAVAVFIVATICQPVLAGGLTMSLAEKGCAQLNHGKYTIAINTLASAVRQAPADLEVRRRLISAFIAVGRAREAIEQLEAITRVAPGNAKDAIMMAEAYYQLEDTRSAIALYKLAVQADPSSATARIGLSRTLMYTGDTSAAIEVCNEALRSSQVQSRQQFIELLSTIRMHASLAHRQLNA